jgi:hypothetical protein
MAALLELNRSQLSGGECAVLAWSIDSGKYSRLTIDRGSGMRSTSAGTSVPTADYNAESDVRRSLSMICCALSRSISVFDAPAEY